MEPFHIDKHHIECRTISTYLLYFALYRVFELSFNKSFFHTYYVLNTIQAKEDTAMNKTANNSPHEAYKETNRRLWKNNRKEINKALKEEESRSSMGVTPK
jgi:hypothetical protein